MTASIPQNPAAVKTAADPAGQLRQTRSLVGAWAKISVLQYFLAEAVVISGWAGPAPYSRRFNVISDLGADRCGIYNGRDVCSPLHWLMDLSFVVQGLAMVVGAVLLSSVLFRVAARPDVPPAVRHPAWGPIIRGLVVVSGVGIVIVGLVPEDTISALHYTGALLFFLAGGLALLALGWSWRGLRIAGWFLLLGGALSLISTILFRFVPGLEPGTLERLMAYPITIGLAIVGLTVARGVHQARAVARARAKT
ncbi:MAG: DUF998 domain-containing protein [Actinomycetota bacterium]|nr:DUF998 domain-containing protein [Actinomycetota bacterium]